MALSIPPFFRTRTGVAAVIVIAVLIIVAIIAATWVYVPNFYTGLGLRHDTSLETYVDALHSVVVEKHPNNLTAWSVTWRNSTAVKVTWGFTYFAQVNATNATSNLNATNATSNLNATNATNATSNQTQLIRYDESFVMTDFFGTKTATSYVASINSTYTLVNTTYGGTGAYDTAFGHPPSTFAVYQQNAGGGVGNFIWQFDQFVQVGSLARTYAA